MSGFVFSEKPIDIASGDGVHLYDSEGTEYLDFDTAYACTPVGHCHPQVVEAVTEQARKLLFVQASYPQASRTAAYETLAAAAPDGLDNVWLCNSGTEANEAAIKFARSATGRGKIVATRNAFHGRTLGALAATWKRKYREPFEPVAGGIEFVEYGDTEAMNDAIDDETAAVILEPIQGEGGINPGGTEFLRTVRVRTAQHGAAIITDEIQTGLGRTGSMWACQRHGVVPDVLTTAKGLASGLPIGATLCRDWIADGAGNHGSTFSGGPVVSAAAVATIETIIDDDLPTHAADRGGYLIEELRDTLGDRVRDVRGEGLMIGIEVKQGANRVLRDLALDHGVLALPAGRTVVRLLPPLVVEQTHADQVVTALDEVLR
jgi:acetylornithine/LysW-gamma-L-lysine aminotransferase